jgi:nucleoside-diphosphate-sugar epimerase
MAKILIIGCGDIGSELAIQLAKDGHEVTGLKRKPPIKSSTVKYIKADVTNQLQLEEITLDFDQVVYILSPTGRGIEAYQSVFELGVATVLKLFEKQCPKAAFTFVSSTRVYGQRNGEWLNEDSLCEPTDERGKILLTAERQFLRFNDKTTVVRFSGIYGRSSYFINQLKKGMGVQKEPPYYTNRIHRDDCIRVLGVLIKKKANAEHLQPIYLATDNDPAPKWEVADFLVKTRTLPKQEAVYLEKNADSNKRLNNSRLLATGFEFKFGSYKDGYNKFPDCGD